MRCHRCRPELIAILLAVAYASIDYSSLAHAQPPESGLPIPQLYTVSPSGGRNGTTVDVTFAGVDLENPEALLFSHPGIKAEPIIPLAPKADPKKPVPPPPVTQFRVKISPKTPPGFYDVRLANRWGVSNPRTFAVGDLPEVAEKESNDDVPQAQRVAINSTINGTVGNPIDVDYYVFAGKKGQRVVVSCLASSIDSRLMPGLDFFNAQGRLLAQNRHYQENDALLDSTLPEDGDYYVRVYEFTHTQGSGEYFYRLTISTGPWIDAVFPPVVEPGKTTLVTLYGRNLPGGQLDPSAVENGSILERLQVAVSPPTDPAARSQLSFSGHIGPQAGALDGFEYRISNTVGISNPALITYAPSPVVLDNEANDTAETAQPVAAPCVIAGRIEKRRDRDWYTFAARKDEVYSIELLSKRLGAETDMYFVLRRADNKQVLVENDDDQEVLAPVKFFSRSEDPPTYRFSAPADGKYELMVASRDADTRAGPRLLYQVRIVPEHPDFQVIVLPAAEFRPDSCCLQKGGAELYTAYVWRHGGWNGPVTLAAEDLPPGVTCAPQTIGPNLVRTPLVLNAAASAWPWTGQFKIKATGTVNGQTVVREARPATMTWPVPAGTGIPAVSRLDRGLMLAVRDSAPFSLSATPEKPAIVQGGKVNIALHLERHWPDFKNPLAVAPVEAQTDLPPGLVFGTNNQPVNLAVGKDEQTVVVTANSSVPPGVYNFVLRGTTQIPFNKDPKAAQKPAVNVLLPAPAFTLTVLPAQVAKISLSNANLTMKPGTQQEITVLVAREQGYQGGFKIELVLPAEVKGIVADEADIPAGKNETKLLLHAAGDATPGNHANLIVRTTAIFPGDVTIVHESKCSVNVAK